VDRRETKINVLKAMVRHVLFLSNGDGTFRPIHSDSSGIEKNSMAAELVDLDRDGLLDLVCIRSPENSGGSDEPERYQDVVYRNTGSFFGAHHNAWLIVNFAGISHHALANARIQAYESGSSEPRKLLGTRHVSSARSFKTGVAMEVHFGLGPHSTVDLELILPGGNRLQFPKVKTRQCVTLDCSTSISRPHFHESVAVRTRPLLQVFVGRHSRLFPEMKHVFDIRGRRVRIVADPNFRRSTFSPGVYLSRTPVSGSKE